MLRQKISIRAIVPVAATLTGFVVVCCLLLYTVIKGDLNRYTIRHSTDLTATVVKATHYAMLKDDRDSLMNTINSIGEQQEVEHVRIFNKQGLIMFSGTASEVGTLVDKVDAGCIGCHAGSQPATRLGPMDQARQYANSAGDEIMAITAPIYNEAACSNSCHAHDASQKILGTLDVGLSMAPLQATLGLLRNRMMIFCLLILFLSVGATVGLLHRNVLLPICQLSAYSDDVVNGNNKPPVFEATEEVQQIARNFCHLADQRDRMRRELDILQPVVGKLPDAETDHS
jgi:nitrogen fixation/metabolism regulation signal transduction histidine kinase